MGGDQRAHCCRKATMSERQIARKESRQGIVAETGCSLGSTILSAAAAGVSQSRPADRVGQAVLFVSLCVQFTNRPSTIQVAAVVCQLVIVRCGGGASLSCYFALDLMPYQLHTAAQSWVCIHFFLLHGEFESSVNCTLF